ncbi:hypothetical protein [Pseudoduganella sp. R-34]|uniref:hypothetical protein n=1 Tax=Pseudoduganella sp. R-34 TaxID=3404062 RepID=UPI003CF8C331
MANMFSKTLRKAHALKQSAIATYSASSTNKKAALKAAVGLAIVMLPEVAFAQSGGNAGAGFFCYIAQYFKAIVGTAALVAITMWAIEHVFKVSKLHDVVITVGTACAIVIGGTTLIVNSGLTTSCVL